MNPNRRLKACSIAVGRRKTGVVGLVATGIFYATVGGARKVPSAGPVYSSSSGFRLLVAHAGNYAALLPGATAIGLADAELSALPRTIFISFQS